MPDDAVLATRMIAIIEKVALVSEPLGTPVTQRHGGDHGQQHLHPKDAVERDLG